MTDHTWDKFLGRRSVSASIDGKTEYQRAYIWAPISRRPWLPVAALIAAVVLFVAALRSDGAAPSTRPMRPEPPANLYLVTPKVWHDADGFSKADIELGLGVVLVDQSIRAAGYDAWEIDRSRRTVAISDEELRKGKSAFEQFKALGEKHRIYIKPSRKYRAVYGRIEGELYIYTDTTVIDVAKYAREHGWCRDTNEEL